MDNIKKWLNGGVGQDDKLQQLKRTARVLSAKAADISTELEFEELQPGKRRKREVDNWLKNVQEVEIQLQRLEERQKDLNVSEFGSVHQASKLTEEVGKLIEQGSFPRGLTIYDHRSSSVTLVTTDTKLNDHKFEDNKRKIMSWITDDSPISTVGIYGPGGVGKTTLLKDIHNELLDHFVSPGHVYWVSASHGITVSMLQDKIAEALNLCYLLQEKNVIRKAATLSYETKQRKKCLLILDDVWEHFSLEDIGIPVGENGCKLILTTRSLDVCRRMKCQEIIKVDPLSENESWKLFAEGLGMDIPLEIKDIAQLVAAECAGLPLGLSVMAGSMRGVYDVQEWRSTLEDLRNSTEGQTDIETDVFPVLKLSFDRLRDPKLRQCFLLCALYPKDGKIRRHELITLIRSEGLVDGAKGWRNQFDKAHSMLNRLENVCLLEKCNDGCVKMHNLIRDMAIRVTKVMPRFMIAAGAELRRIPSGSRWTVDLDKVSLMHNSLSEILPGTVPMCPCLSTLLLQRNPFTKLPDNFFVHMKVLTVLNLSQTSIKILPSSISELTNLRSLLLEFCTRLKFVPPLMKLSKLRELDLSFCWSMKDIPHGIQELADLRFLDLEGSKNLCRLLRGSLPALAQLECLKLDPDEQSISGDQVEKLEHLERLEGCRINDVSSFNRYVKTQHFQQLYYYEFVVGAGEYKKIEYSQLSSDETAQNTSTNEERIVVVCSRSLRGGSEEELLIPPGNVQYLQIHNCEFNMRSLIDALPSLNGLTALRTILIRRSTKVLFLLSSLSCFETAPFQRVQELILTDLQHFSGLAEEGVAIPPGAFFSLKRLVVKFCPKISKLFHSSLLKSGLDSLQELEIEGCEELETVVSTTDSDNADTQIESIEAEGDASDVCWIPNLRTLHLRCLPKLTSICHRGLLGNGFLERIIVDDCPEIKLIFMVSLPQCHLRNLKDIKVISCKNLQEIIASADLHCQKNGGNELPNLRSIVLDDLQNLTSLFSGNIPTCSSIKQIAVRLCPKLRRLPLSIPLVSNNEPSNSLHLQEIRADREWWESLAWDNLYLKQILQPFIKFLETEKSSFEIITELMSPESQIEGKKLSSDTVGISMDNSSYMTELSDV